MLNGLLLEPDLDSLPSTTRAPEPVVPVESPREEKKLIKDFQVTEEAIRSTPLLMK